MGSVFSSLSIKKKKNSDTPFLVVTAALLKSIIPIAIGQQWSLFNRFKSNHTTTTKSVNDEETVRQAIPEQGCTRFMYLNRLQGKLTLLL